jgi:hypothetical protein
MSNPHNYLSDLLESVLTDRTSEMDDVHTDPVEYQGPPGQEVLAAATGRGAHFCTNNMPLVSCRLVALTGTGTTASARPA